jgi:hypothetical protein
MQGPWNILVVSLGMWAAACGQPSVQFGLPPGVTVPDGGSSGVADGGLDGLPCDVSQFLQSQCLACHSNPPAGGAPMSLVSYADLTRPALSAPTQTEAQLSVQRMQSSTLPMPPGTHLSASEIAILKDWVAAGSKQGACSAGNPTDGGTADAGTVTAQCSSNTFWTGGTQGSELMSPGHDCIACHSTRNAPSLGVAGTVFSAFHDADDCNGASGATVVITDADGVMHSYPTNAAGNFFSPDQLKVPFRALVKSSTGHIQAMVSPQSVTSCNSCHTQAGTNSSPGRIVAP